MTIKRITFLVWLQAFVFLLPAAQASAQSGYVGIMVQELQADMARAIGLNETGALVRDIELNSPGNRAGMHRGDLITKVNGQTVETVDQLVGVFRDIKIDEQVALEGFRALEPMSWSLTATAWPKSRKVTKGAFASLPGVGITVAALTEKVRTRFNIPWGSTGLLVTLVAPGANTGASLKRGDVIHQVNQQPVWHPDQMTKIYADAKEAGRKFLLLMVENNRGYTFQKMAIK